MSRPFLASVTLLIVNGLLVMAGSVILLISTVSWWGPTLGRWLSAPEFASHGDAIIILGGDTLKKVETGLALYHEGLASRLVITGYNPKLQTPDEAQIARDWAISHGVPAGAITLLTTSNLTEDAQQIAQFSHEIGAQRITIVSEWQYGRRALCMVEKLTASDHVEVTFQASAGEFNAENWWQSEKTIDDVLLENLKLVYYALKYHFPIWDYLGGDANVPNLLALCVIGFPLSFATAALVRGWALRKRMFDIPNERSSHATPTPRGGGLAIASVTLLLFTVSLFTIRNPGVWSTLIIVLTAGSVALIGWIDDRHHLSVRIRFGIQFGTALVIVATSGAITAINLPFLRLLSLGTLLGTAITIVWIVGLTNIYNFMDGIDGLAASQAIVAGICWCFLFLVENQPALFLLAGLLVTTSLGFLFLNASPARIFMGDVGSTFLGFVLAILPVLAFSRLGNPRLWIAGAMFVGPFLIDGGLTIILRALRKEDIFQAHCSHVYQRLVKIGQSHARVTGLYGFLATLSAFGGLAFYAGLDMASFAIFVLVLMIYGAAFAFIAFVENAQRRVVDIPARSVSGLGSQPRRTIS